MSKPEALVTADAILHLLKLAESWGQWELVEALIDYTHKAGLKVLYGGPSLWAIKAE